MIIGPLLGRAESGQISKVVTLSRWFNHRKTEMGRPKTGLFYKVVRLSGWSHSKVYASKCSRLSGSVPREIIATGRVLNGWSHDFKFAEASSKFRKIL